MKKIFIYIALLVSSLTFGQHEMMLMASYQQAQNTSGYDADAEAFMIATGIPDDGTVYYTGTPQEITGAEMWEAIDDLVKGYKAAGTWDKFYAIYPFIGGTASTHKWNLKDPRDVNTAFRMSFVGSWTHNAMGAKGEGTFALDYADTFFVDSEQLTINSGTIDLSIGYYNTLDESPRPDDMEMGNGDWDSASSILFETNYNNEAAWGGLYGMWVLNEEILPNVMYSELSAISGSAKYYRDGINKGATNTQSGASFTNQSIVINAIREEFPNTNTHRNSLKRAGFAYIGKGLTSADVTANYTLFRSFQDKLNR